MLSFTDDVVHMLATREREREKEREREREREKERKKERKKDRKKERCIAVMGTSFDLNFCKTSSFWRIGWPVKSILMFIADFHCVESVCGARCILQPKFGVAGGGGQS